MKLYFIQADAVILLKHSLQERSASTIPTYFWTRGGDNSLLAIYSTLLSSKFFFLVAFTHHKLGKCPRKQNTRISSRVVLAMAAGRLEQPEQSLVKLQKQTLP